METAETLRKAEETLYRNMREYGRCYAIVDQVFRENFADILMRWSDSLPKVELHHRQFPKACGLAPLLFEIDIKNFDLATEMQGLAYQHSLPDESIRSVCAFLSGPTELEMLGKRLSRALDAQAEKGPRFYFRYFDPRVFQHLGEILNVAQISKLCGDTKSWMYFSYRREFVEIDPRGETRQDSVSPISPEQWQRLVAIDVVNRAIRKSYELNCFTTSSFSELFPLARWAMGELPTVDDQAALIAMRLLGRESPNDVPLDYAIRLCREHGIPFEMAYQRALQIA